VERSASRPPIPGREEYGPPEGEPAGEPVSWETVSGWLEAARYYWLACTRRDGRPHAVAIWAVWRDERLFFATSPETVTAQVLSANPNALVHLESAVDVAVVEGSATRLAPADVPSTVVEAYTRKYDWRIDPADPEMPYYVLRPRLVLAWRLPDIRGTATRWRF
jgi:hypothetical protein